MTTPRDVDPSGKDQIRQMLDKSDRKAEEELSREEFQRKQNEELTRLLRLLPFQIFLLVADADEQIDPKEVARFKAFLSERKKHCSNSYSLRIFHQTVVNYGVLTNRYYSGKIKKDITLVEKAMHYIRMCVSKEMAQKIFDDLIALAAAIAEASGGFMGMTSSISKEEEEMLHQLEEIVDRVNEQVMEGSGYKENNLTI